MPTFLRASHALGIKKRTCLLLLIVLILLLLVQAITHYDWFREGKELQANLSIPRTVAKTFDGFVKNILDAERAIGLTATASPPLSAENLRRSS